MLGKSELSECCLKVVVAEINDQLVLLNSPTGLNEGRIDNEFDGRLC